MAVVRVQPEPLSGPWVEGFVLDKHVVKSTPIGEVHGHMQFDTVRTELGERVFSLKNRAGAADDIVDTAVAFIQQKWSSSIDCVVAVPPSVGRTKQPAVVIARGIAKGIGVPFLPDAANKEKPTPQMKNVPPHERAPLLKKAIDSGTAALRGKRVLIVDDLWETGSSMKRVAEVVHEMGAAEIRVLAMTRTK